MRPVIGEDLYNLIISEKSSNVVWKLTATCVTSADSATVTSTTAFTSGAKGWYAEGDGIPMFKDGYTDSEDNHYTKIATFTDDSSITLNATANAGGTSITLYSPIGYLVEKQSVNWDAKNVGETVTITTLHFLKEICKLFKFFFI